MNTALKCFQQRSNLRTRIIKQREFYLLRGLLFSVGGVTFPSLCLFHCSFIILTYRTKQFYWTELMRWIVRGSCNHSICICFRGNAHRSWEVRYLMRRMQCNDFCLVPEGFPPPCRLRNHPRVVTSTHVCIVADIIVHNHEMMMSWCAQKPLNARSNAAIYSPPFEACFVGAWLLEEKKNRAKSCQTFSPSCWQEQCGILSMEEKRISHPYTPTRQVG